MEKSLCVKGTRTTGKKDVLHASACFLQSLIICTEYFQTQCSLLSKKSSGRNSTMCYNNLFRNLDNLLIT